jgi:hypothetical protein|tara:strand:- start:123 stop:971 length:849 start_codon:yes stop_codon:yes gene_type:complete
MTTNQNNPLRQYFRRPSVFISLPSGGKGYEPGDIEFEDENNKELPVYPMTAIDEITTKTPDALFNGSATVEIIKSCIPAIKNPWNVLSCDIDAILIGIKAAGGEEALEVESSCPKEDCDTTENYAINLQNLLRTIKSGDYDKPFISGELTIYFKPIGYKIMNEISLQQFSIQAKFANLNTITDDAERVKESQSALVEITEVTMDVLTHAIDKIVSPDGEEVTDKEYIIDFLKNCDTKSYEAIRDHNGELRSESTIKSLDMKCATCGHEYKQQFTLNATDFFA